MDPRVVVCAVAVSLHRPPCYPVEDRPLDGVGPLPTWHLPGKLPLMNDKYSAGPCPPSFTRLCLTGHCTRAPRRRRRVAA
jgi:hypothetical protein